MRNAEIRVSSGPTGEGAPAAFDPKPAEDVSTCQYAPTPVGAMPEAFFFPQRPGTLPETPPGAAPFSAGVSPAGQASASAVGESPGAARCSE